MLQCIYRNKVTSYKFCVMLWCVFVHLVFMYSYLFIWLPNFMLSDVLLVTHASHFIPWKVMQKSDTNITKNEWTHFTNHDGYIFVLFVWWFQLMSWEFVISDYCAVFIWCSMDSDFEILSCTCFEHRRLRVHSCLSVAIQAPLNWHCHSDNKTMSSFTVNLLFYLPLTFT